jgi:hypothetical protein
VGAPACEPLLQLRDSWPVCPTAACLCINAQTMGQGTMPNQWQGNCRSLIGQLLIAWMHTFAFPMLDPMHDLWLSSQDVPPHVLKSFTKASEAFTLRKTYEEAVAPGKEAGGCAGVPCSKAAPASLQLHCSSCNSLSSRCLAGTPFSKGQLQTLPLLTSCYGVSSHLVQDMHYQKCKSV